MSVVLATTAGWLYCGMLASSGEGPSLDHISIEVSDLDDSVRFYEGLGLVQQRTSLSLPGLRVAWFKLREGLELHLIESDGSPSGHRIDIRKRHFALSVSGDFEALSEAVSARFAESRRLEGNEVFRGQHFFEDPDGNLIEVNQRLGAG